MKIGTSEESKVVDQKMNLEKGNTFEVCFFRRLIGNDNRPQK